MDQDGTDFFPYHRIGYRSNPFRALTPEEWNEIAVLHPDIVEALKTSSHILIMGHKGRGKTSALHAACRYLSSQGNNVVFEYIPERRHTFKTDLSIRYDIVCIDEVQRLTPAVLLRLINTAKRIGLRLILSSHTNISLLFLLKKMPLISINLDQYNDLQRIKTVIERRLDFFALHDMERCQLSDEEYNQLHAKYATDIRAMEHHLYDLFKHQAYTRTGGCNSLTDKCAGVESTMKKD